MIKNKIDKKFLASIGLNTDDESENADNIAMLFSVLDRAVDYRVKDELGIDKANEYLIVKTSSDLFKPWTEKNLPNFDELVSEEIEKIKERYDERKKKFDEHFKKKIERR